MPAKAIASVAVPKVLHNLDNALKQRYLHAYSLQIGRRPDQEPKFLHDAVADTDNRSLALKSIQRFQSALAMVKAIGKVNLAKINSYSFCIFRSRGSQEIYTAYRPCGNAVNEFDAAKYPTIQFLLENILYYIYNKEQDQLDSRPRRNFTYVLRERLILTRTTVGCEKGGCGA